MKKIMIVLIYCISMSSALLVNDCSIPGACLKNEQTPTLTILNLTSNITETDPYFKQIFTNTSTLIDTTKGFRQILTSADNVVQYVTVNGKAVVRMLANASDSLQVIYRNKSDSNKIILSTAGTSYFYDNISSTIFISTQATGKSPFQVASTTVNTNLNADYLDGQHSSYFSPTTHKYHTFANNEYSFDSYAQSNYLRLFSTSAMYDSIRQVKINQVLYYNGSNYVNWTSQNGTACIEKLLDGDATARCALNKTERNFMIELDRGVDIYGKTTGGEWPLTALMNFKTDYTPITYNSSGFRIDSWTRNSTGVWNFKDAMICNSTYVSGVGWGQCQKATTTALHNGERLIRFYINFSSWVDSGLSNRLPLIDFSIYSNYLGTPNPAWYSDYYKNYFFPHDIITNGTFKSTPNLGGTGSTGIQGIGEYYHAQGNSPNILLEDISAGADDFDILANQGELYIVRTNGTIANKTVMKIDVNNNIIFNETIIVSNLRVINSSLPACGVSTEGTISYNLTTKKHVGCNSTGWFDLY